MKKVCSYTNKFGRRIWGILEVAKVKIVFELGEGLIINDHRGTTTLDWAPIINRMLNLFFSVFADTSCHTGW